MFSAKEIKSASKLELIDIAKKWNKLNLLSFDSNGFCDQNKKQLVTILLGELEADNVTPQSSLPIQAVQPTKPVVELESLSTNNGITTVLVRDTVTTTKDIFHDSDKVLEAALKKETEKKPKKVNPLTIADDFEWEAKGEKKLFKAGTPLFVMTEALKEGIEIIALVKLLSKEEHKYGSFIKATEGAKLQILMRDLKYINDRGWAVNKSGNQLKIS